MSPGQAGRSGTLVVSSIVSLLSEGPYRLDDLGWLQFERLCAEVLELGAERWRGRADRGRVAVVPEGVPAPLGGNRIPGPALVVAAWARPAQVSWIEEAVRSARRDEPGTRSLLLVTNAPPPPPHEGLVVLGPRELGVILDAHPELRLRLPSVLGVRDLAGLIADETGRRSTADLDAARRLARVFVPTRAYAHTLDVLERHRFAVLTEPPEMGKTAIARMVALAKLTAGWEAHECIRPDELWRLFARDRPQVFIADDAFGSTEYHPDAAERWALELDRVLRAMDERHWLIWTSRPAPLKAGLRRIHREHGTERFPQPAQVEVAAAELDLEEKASILFRHARAAPLEAVAVQLVQANGWDIVSHAHFTPERIRRFVADRLPALASSGPPTSRRLTQAVSAEIREPTTAMAASLRALGPEHRALLVALLDAPPGPVPERELAAAVRRHSDAGFPRPPGALVDRLTDHFVRLVPPTSVTWCTRAGATS